MASASGSAGASGGAGGSGSGSASGAAGGGDDRGSGDGSRVAAAVRVPVHAHGSLLSATLSSAGIVLGATRSGAYGTMRSPEGARFILGAPARGTDRTQRLPRVRTLSRRRFLEQAAELDEEKEVRMHPLFGLII